ncbi:MAG: hypothetical protein K2F87_04555 [Muribaculaceae bacterium]|nr:hypothetical protein [Muribaculaceae bacterium]
MLRLKLSALLAVLTLTFTGLRAQVTTEQTPLYDNSQNVVIYYHADEGNRKLANQPEDVEIYAHTGVITSTSKDDTDWKYASEWGKNLAKYKMTYVSPNLYKLDIGNLKEFYGIKSDSEVIRKLVFVFRTADSKKEGKGTGDTDITVDVISTALQIDFTSDLEGTTITTADPTVHFTLTSNQEAEEMWISINLERVAEATNTKKLEFDYTFTQPGQYSIYGNVKVDGKVTSRSMKYNMVEASEEKPYPGGTPKMGAVRAENGDVIFCFAAPQKKSVEIVGSWNAYQPVKMYRADVDGIPYFWTAVSGLASDKPYFYYYFVDGNYRVGDPYARLVLDPWNDSYIPKTVYPDMPAYPSEITQKISVAVYQENLNDYEWTDTDFRPVAKKDLVIYELLFRDFTGTEGQAKGNGTVRQAIGKIPYLKALGINAVELLPINQFNGNISWGYNPNFYFAPDKAYGTPDDYKEFIDTCHKNGIAVILDMVFNQTDWQHPWYVMYNVGQNPMYNADAPHAYSVLNDWNQGHPLVRQQWKDVVKYWMEEYHVDGYRFDLVKGLGDNNSYANSGDAATNAYNASRVANMRAIQDAMNEVNTDAYFINENLAGAKEENEMAETGMLNWANVNDAGCQYAMGQKSNSSLNRMYAKNDSRTINSTVAYLESHDEQRLAYKQIKYGVSAVKNNHALACRRLGSAAAQMILCPGAHMIWQFSEMGNAQSTKNDDGGNNVDPKIVNWNLLDDPDNKGLMEDYATLISIRTSNPDLFAVEEGATFSMTCGANNWDNGRMILASTTDKQLIAVINPTIDKELTVEAAFNFPASSYVIASQSYGTANTFDAAAGTVTVAPNSYVVITTNNLSTVSELPTDESLRMMAYGVDGTLMVDNAAAGIRVYDLTGSLRFSTQASAARVEMPAGIYIVRSGNQAVKVLLH